MQEIIAQFPTPSDQSTNHSGQIFAIHFPHLQSTREPLKDGAPVKAADLSPRQRQMLVCLSEFHHATADLLLRKLDLSPASYRYVQKQLHALASDKPEEQFVEITIPPKRDESRYGSAPYVYTLGRRGYKYLRDKGYPVGRYREAETRVQKEFPLRHRLAVNEFLLKAQLLETEETPGVQQTQVTLQQFLHEKYWNAHPLRVQTPDAEKPTGLSPDLLLTFSLHRQYWFPVEINLSEPWRKDWEAKVRLYRYCMLAYRERLGTSAHHNPGDGCLQ